MLLAIAGGCGRLGFADEPAPAGGGTGGSGSDAPIAQLLACGSPTRFDIGNADALANLTPVATTNGFAVFTVGNDGTLAGWSYAFDGPTLAASETNVALGTGANGTFGGTVVGDDIMVASSTGQPATGTTLFSLDRAARDDRRAERARERSGPASSRSRRAAPRWRTRHSQPQGDADVRLVDAAGADASAITKVGAATDKPNAVAVLATNTGFALGYATGNDGRARLATFDQTLAPLVAPTKIDPGSGIESPWFGYAPAFDEFLVAWHEKDASDDDNVFATILDGNSNVVVAPFEVAPFSQYVTIGSDATGFWLTYVTYDPNNVVPDHLVASHVDAAGAITPRAVTRVGRHAEQLEHGRARRPERARVGRARRQRPGSVLRSDVRLTTRRSFDSARRSTRGPSR